RFYAHESCGQCTPCRESTGWIEKIVHRIVEGHGHKDDLDTVLDVAKRGGGATICAFYDGAIGPYISYIEKFRPELGALCGSFRSRGKNGGWSAVLPGEILFWGRNPRALFAGGVGRGAAAE